MDKLATKARRDEIRKLVEKVGFWNIKQKDLADHYQVSKQAVQRDMTLIKDECNVEDVNVISREIYQGYKTSIMKLRKIAINSNNNKEVMMAIKILGDINDKMTNFLENWGYKNKVAEKIITLTIEQKEVEIRRILNL